MGQAKQRGTFEERVKNAKNTHKTTIEKIQGKEEIKTMREFIELDYLNEEDVYCKSGSFKKGYGFINATFTHKVHGDMMKLNGKETITYWKPFIVGKQLYNAVKGMEYYRKLGLIDSNPAITKDNLIKENKSAE
jgi:hypothetical protein|tara:strand:+ start:659 stop:1060 length:402 start_codon:yes stop_codon:yes gene_type:complete